MKEIPIDLYYTPPPDDIFNEVKEASIQIWKEYDNTYGYVDEKVGRIEKMKNVGDSLMSIVAMFDITNQCILSSRLSGKSKKAIRDRLMARDILMADGNKNYILEIFN